MLKVLMKKQMREIGAFLYQDSKKGKRRSKGNFVGYLILLAAIYVMMFAIFFFVGGWIGQPLLAAGLDWMYFAMMGLMSIALGVFGSVFNTFSSLYVAKDNEMILSLPVKPGEIILARLSGVYIMGLAYEIMVYLPAILVYQMKKGFHVGALLASLVSMLVISFFVLVLSALLGWVVACISVHLKNKSFITVIISLIFIGAYYYFYAKAYDLISNLLQNADKIGNVIRGRAAIIYHMGMAATGQVSSLGIITGIAVVLVLAVYVILQKSFYRITMMKKGEKKAIYKETKMTAGSLESALFRKELKRFLGSATYMLNCGLGIVIVLIGAGVVLWKQNMLIQFTEQYSAYRDEILLMITAAVSMVSVMNTISAPSISLEGKNLWILQSLPVSPWQVIKAKCRMHILLTAVPALICIFCVEIVLKPDLFFAVLMPVSVVLLIIVSALSGLLIGLKTPNLNWTSETAAVKQSLGVMIALFGNWLFVGVLALICYAVRNIIVPRSYLILCMVLCILLIRFMIYWLKGKGSKKFAEL